MNYYKYFFNIRFINVTRNFILQSVYNILESYSFKFSIFIKIDKQFLDGMLVSWFHGGDVVMTETKGEVLLIFEMFFTEYLVFFDSHGCLDVWRCIPPVIRDRIVIYYIHNSFLIFFMLSRVYVSMINFGTRTFKYI